MYGTYAGTEWLRHMTEHDLANLLDRMPALEAEAALVAATVAMLPDMKPSRRKRIVREWRRLAAHNKRVVLEGAEDLRRWLWNTARIRG